MRLIALLLLITTISPPLFTQPDKIIQLEECYEKAWGNHPLSRKAGILQSVSEVELEKIDASRLPDISWNAQASLQSENVEFPFELPIPNYSGLDLPLYRFQTSLDGQYSLYDGGIREARKEIETAAWRAKEAEANIAKASLKEKVNQMALGIALQRAKVDILESSKSAMLTRQKQLEAAVKHGVALPGAVKELRAEMLRLESEISQAKGSINGLIQNLGYLIGEELANDTEVRLPEMEPLPVEYGIKRPEIDFFQAQKQSLLARESLITARQKPKVGAFIQLGIGAPNPLNFFDESLSPFAMGGLRFSWKFIDWKQSERDRQLLSLQSQLVNNQQAAFEHQVRTTDGQQRETIATLEASIARDRQIIELHEEILQQKAAQLQQGVITSSDYILQATALRQARLALNQHELQLVKVKIDFLTQKGLL